MARKARSASNRKKDTVLGLRLARLRNERAFTQVELAEKLGIAQPIISDSERGRRRPHSDVLSRLAAALQVSADELLGLKKSEKPAPLNRRFLRRLQAVDQLPKRDQEALLRSIDAFLAARKAS